MNQKRVFLPRVPLYYSIPMLLVCMGALFILVALFNVEVPVLLLQPVPSNAVNVSSCGTLNQNDVYYVLNQSINLPVGPSVECILITGNNTLLDGEFKHLISGNGGPNDVGVSIFGRNVSVLRVNVTNSRIGIITSSNDSYIFNNFINATYGTGIGAGTGASRSKIIGNYIVDSVSGIAIGNIFNLVPSFEHIVQNNTIYGNSIYVNNPIHNGFDFGISLAKVYSSNITGNIIYKPNTLRGILINYSDYNLLSANRLDGPFVNGINYANSFSNSVSQTEIYNSSNSALYIHDSVNNTSISLKNISIFNTNISYFDLELFSFYPNISSILIEDSSISSYRFNQTKVALKKNGNALVNFTQPLNVSGTNLSSDIRLGFSHVEVDSTLRQGLNKSAIITFFGLSTNFVNATMYRNGVQCPANVCVNLTSLNAGNVSFTVMSWTNYSVAEGIVPNIPTITINEPDPGESYLPTNFPVTFGVDLNINGTVKFSLNNGSTNVTMNTTDNREFTYSQSSLSTGNYTFTAYANLSNGANLNKSVNFRVAVPGNNPSPPNNPNQNNSNNNSTNNPNQFPNPSNSTRSNLTSVSSSSDLGNNSSATMRNVIYWLIISVLSIMTILLILLIVKALRNRLVENNSPTVFSNLR